MRTPAAWWRSVKRRQPGAYCYVTRRHLKPGQEIGYVGKSRHLPSRDRDHRGVGRYGHAEKPWADLIVRRYALTLPWWLGWDWITLSLETVAILVLRPRYNVQKNPRRRKVGPREQMMQRMVRDSLPLHMQTRVHMRVHWMPVLAGIMIIVGIGGWLWSR